MKILEEIWNSYFSQLGLLEIIVYLIAFGCISGFSIAISVYHLWIKNDHTHFGSRRR